MVAEIFGMDGIVVLVVVMAVLFGGTQIPQIRRARWARPGASSPRDCTTAPTTRHRSEPVTGPNA